MTEQLFTFLSSLSNEDRAEYFSGKVRVYELTFAFAANGEVHSQEFETVLAANAAQARMIGKKIGNFFNHSANGWNGFVGVKEVR